MIVEGFEWDYLQHYPQLIRFNLNEEVGNWCDHHTSLSVAKIVTMPSTDNHKEI